MASKDCTSIVGIDVSDVSHQALDQALEVTGLRAGEVHVVDVEPDSPHDMMSLAPLVEPTPVEALLVQVRRTYSSVNDGLVGNGAAAYAATPERGA